MGLGEGGKREEGRRRKCRSRLKIVEAWRESLESRALGFGGMDPENSPKRPFSAAFSQVQRLTLFACQ